MRHRRPAASRLFAALTALAVGGAGLAAVATLPGAAQAAVTSARNLPANGQIRLFVGQDSDTISAYKRDTAAAGTPAPGGVTLYTNIVLGGTPAPLAGLDGPVDYGSGPQDVPRSLAENPGAALAVGLYLSDSSAGCGNQPLRAIINRPDADVQAGNPSLATQYRAQVDQMVTKLKSTNRQVFLRIGYEYDGPWNCYNTDFYKQAYRYIKTRIDALGGTNIATVWQSAAWPLNTATDHPEYNQVVTAANHFDVWYPGDDVVDWVGMSAFYGATYKTPQWSCSNVDATPRSLQDRVVSFARARNKPVMIAEAAPQGFQTGAKTGSCILAKNPQPTTGDAIWNTWYKDFFDYVEANRDTIRAVAYINTNWDSQTTWQCNGAPAGQPGCANGYWGDSRVQADPTVLSRWAARLKTSYWVNGTGTPPTTPPTTPTTPPTGGTSRNPYATVEAESFDATQGVEVVANANSASASGGKVAGRIANGDWVRYDRLAFGSTAPKTLTLRYSSGVPTSSSFTVEVRDGSATGTILAAPVLRGTGAWSTFASQDIALTGALSGTRSIALRVKVTGTGEVVNLDSLKFATTGTTPPPTNPTPTSSPTPGGGPLPTATSRGLLIGQGNSGSYTDFTNVTKSNPTGGSVYYGVKAATFSGATGTSSHKAYADFLANAGKSMEVGISWKDDPPGWTGGDEASKAVASRQVTRDIATGKYDSNFNVLADYIRAHPASMFYLRLDYEVSSYYHCNSTTDCSNYKAAFRHLVSYLDGRTGGANVRYVYHPVRGEFDKLYPGDDVVDDIGVSVFNQDLCHAYFENNTAYWNGDGDRNAKTCSGYQTVLVGGNKNAQRYEYPVDQNILRMMWWAQQHKKPMIVAESGVQRMAAPLDGNGVQSQADFTSYINRLGTLLNYRGPLPNGVVDGKETDFVGTYDLSKVITTVAYINVDWRYGFDGKVSADQPFGFGPSAGWYVNSLLSANPGGKTAVCNLLVSGSFATRCS